MSDNTLIIYTFTGIEFNIDSDKFGIAKKQEVIYHRIEGGFYYKDLLVDGQLILSEQLLDSLLSTASLTINKIIDGVIYITITDKKVMEDITTKQLRVEHLAGYDVIDDCDDDIFTFYSIDT